MKSKFMIKTAIFISVCLAFSGCTIVALEVYSSVFDSSRNADMYDKDGHYVEWGAGYERQEFYFYSGKNKLKGYVYEEQSPVKNGLVVISPGIYSYADQYGFMIRNLVNHGWRVFSYDITGVGESEGYSMGGLTQSVLDLKAALDYIEANRNNVVFDGLPADFPVMLLGFSMGGYAVCAVLNFNPNVKAVVSLAGFNNTKDVSKYQAVSEIGGIYYLVTPQVWAIENQLFGSLANLTAVDGINNTQIPVLVIHSEDDNIIPINTISIYAQKNNIRETNVMFHVVESYEEAGHYLRRFDNTPFYFLISSFLENALNK